MAEFNVVHTPALSGATRGRLGRTAPAAAGVRLMALPEGRVLHVLAADERALDTDLRAAALGDVRFCSVGQWFIVGDEPLSRGDPDALSRRLADVAAVSDQSHGRVRIGISGPNVRDLLAKGTAVDLDDAAFPVGRSVMTLIGHIGVNLARTGADKYEMIVLRGFAESLWDEMIHMGLEFGVECH